MRVRLTHIDGKLPNLALMKIAAWHKARGDQCVLTRSVERELDEPERYGAVYGSAIFSYSAPRVAHFRQQFPDAIVGGTYNVTDASTVEAVLGLDPDDERFDYSIYPGFDASIGFSQRGCRLKCGFCVVPKKEGKPRSVNRIDQIWRGPPWPKHLHLLDNDFFGQAEWRERIREIRDGGFKVCLNQGINVRMIDEAAAEALASIPYYDDSFRQRRLYTAWDNIGDEKRFFAGVDRLERFGVPPLRLFVYMLVGYDRQETWERVLYRLNRMLERSIRPYPMIYGDRERSLPLGGADPRCAKRTLAEFQRYVIRRIYTITTFGGYDASERSVGAKPGKPGQAAEQQELF